ncbi:MAG: DUF4286 family protein [Cyclobacteriaceae bacterium]
MILYNVTVNIDFSVEEEWKKWMKDEHIPKVLATGTFISNKMYKLLNEVPDATGATYSVQYICESMNKLDHYIEKFAPVLVQEHVEKYGNQHVAFRSILQEV